jgi:hypothetical protein
VLQPSLVSLLITYGSDMLTSGLGEIVYKRAKFNVCHIIVTPQMPSRVGTQLQTPSSLLLSPVPT